ncbi:MAG: YkgJ family cysteine cluster protein [Thermodesulfobacteria bacterium]|nr:YkgJ family cysteine cluster protein [Thermodesulfobacteriota bacterium]
MKDFKCKRCGECCKGESTISLSEEDIKNIASYLGLSEKEFLFQYTVKKFPNRIEMKVKDGHCIFFDPKTKMCKIHPVKPKMCKNWPLIPAIINDKTNFEIVKNFCKGLRELSWEDLKNLKILRNTP